MEVGTVAGHDECMSSDECMSLGCSSHSDWVDHAQVEPPGWEIADGSGWLESIQGQK